MRSFEIYSKYDIPRSKYSKYDIPRSKFLALYSPPSVLQGMIVLENELLEAKVGLERDVVL